MTDTAAAPRVVHLRRGGTSVVLRLDPAVLPCILHWGPDLGAATDDELADIVPALGMPFHDSIIASQETVAVLPQQSSGWVGRPGLLGHRTGKAWSVAFDHVDHVVEEAGSGDWAEGASGAVRVRSTGTDRPGELEVTTEIELHPSGLLRARAAVRNLAAEAYEVTLLEPALPVPAEADELLDMTGRWGHERTPQRRPFDMGQWVREAWGGRPGHESATVLCAGRGNFGFRSGRVWGVHLAYSGNQVLSAEHSFTGWRMLRGGELLLPGEILLAQGETYSSPWLVGSWGEGLDDLSSRFHRFLRARPNHPSTPRPVLINTWEAVYFDHNLDRLLDLAEKAAALGVERYVLDDGWFRHRRDDKAGLGDWFVDEDVWPNGLTPLVDRVHELGMEFGLWFEPEMVNLDSDLAREHPEWIFGTAHGPGIPSRFQHVLDLGHPEAYAYILKRISALVTEYRIAYIKWDHNRPLTGAGHSPHFTPGVHAQTEALYRMLAELKRRHPGLEIESCASGGARIDLGILEHTDRVWTSDCIDAHERQRMVRWTGLLLPPELMGTHIGSGADHTTDRMLDLSFRGGTAIWGHFGIEWDLANANEADNATLAGWVAIHKELRELLHHGDVVRADPTNAALLLEGVVSSDKRDALYRLAAIDHTVTWPPGRVTLPGLDPERSYRVTARWPGNDAVTGPRPPGWAAGVTLAGRVLGEIGIQSPLLSADHLVLIRAEAV